MSGVGEEGKSLMGVFHECDCSCASALEDDLAELVAEHAEFKRQTESALKLAVTERDKYKEEIAQLRIEIRDIVETTISIFEEKPRKEDGLYQHHGVCSGDWRKPPGTTSGCVCLRGYKRALREVESLKAQIEGVKSEQTSLRESYCETLRETMQDKYEQLRTAFEEVNQRLRAERDKYKEEADRRTREIELTYGVQKRMREEIAQLKEQLDEARGEKD